MRDNLKRRISNRKYRQTRRFCCPLCFIQYKPRTQNDKPHCTNRTCLNAMCMPIHSLTRGKVRSSEPTDADLDAEALSWLEQCGY